MCEAQETLDTKRMPLDISVVTPIYNRASLLARVWDSLRSQTPGFEWIVVDDGSTDETEEAIRQLRDPRIVYHRLPSNRGVNAARNAGAALATGRYVVFLDSDDELYPGSMARMVDIMDSADPSIGVSMFLNVMAGREASCKSSQERVVLYENEMITNPMSGDRICVYRKQVTERFSLPEDLRGCEYLFLCNISRRHRFLLVGEPGSIVHRQGDNLSDAGSVVARSRDMAVLYERILNNHIDVLCDYPQQIVDYLIKAMYRYGVAGNKASSLKAYRRILRQRPTLLALLKATGALVLCFLGAARFERCRINCLNRRLEV